MSVWLLCFNQVEAVSWHCLRIIVPSVVSEGLCSTFKSDTGDSAKSPGNYTYLISPDFSS